MVQELLGRGNVVFREANGSEEEANVIADLGVAFESPTFPTEIQPFSCQFNQLQEEEEGGG